MGKRSECRYTIIPDKDLPKINDIIDNIKKISVVNNIPLNEMTVNKYSKHGGKYDGRMMRRLGGFQSIINKAYDSNPGMSGVNIATLDIETAPLESYHWGLWKENIGIDQIRCDWTILSFSVKWLGENRVYFHSTGGRGIDKVRDDINVLQKLWDVLNKADMVIVQNGEQFDIKAINSRLVINGFLPYSPIKIIDTKIIAKKHFRFASNKLQWLATSLTDVTKNKHTTFPGFELWAECLKDNPKAWREMKKYNKQDVIATEKVYITLRPWIQGHPNVAAYSNSDRIKCPKCGSPNLHIKGKYFTQSGEYTRLVCNYCGGWSRTRYTTNSVSKRKLLLSN